MEITVIFLTGLTGAASGCCRGNPFLFQKLFDTSKSSVAVAALVIRTVSTKGVHTEYKISKQVRYILYVWLLKEIILKK